MSHGEDYDPSFEDLAPGDEPVSVSGVAAGIRGYSLGFVIAVLLTVGSFLVASSRGDAIWGPGIPIALIVLAIAQIGVHLTFFLHITTGPDNTNNVMALAFGVFVVVLIVAGSLWVMSNMNGNMTPQAQMLYMQKQQQQAF